MIWITGPALAVTLSFLAGFSRQSSPPVLPPLNHGRVPLQLDFDTGHVLRDMETYLREVSSPSGIPKSFCDTSPYVFDQESGQFFLVNRGEVGYLEDQAFTYDLALAAIGYLLLDRRTEAEHLLSILEDDFYLEKNGIIGLYNAYRPSSKVPFEELNLGADGDRMHTGPMLWVAFAALHHTSITRSTRYLDFVLDMVAWCRDHLAYYQFEDGGKGGISMGFGWGPDWSEIFSTEHIIDYFSLLRMLRSLYDEAPAEVRKLFIRKGITAEWLEKENEETGRFLFEIGFFEESYCFRAGVNKYGIDDTRILDGTSWGIAGVGPENYIKWGIDPDRLMDTAEQTFKATYTMPDGRVLEGCDITDFAGTGEARDALLWFEGTGQFIVALGEMVLFHEKQGNLEKAEAYRSKAKKYIEDMHHFSYTLNLGGALPYMAVRPGKNQILRTLKWEWEIPRGRGDHWVRSMSSTMWFLYCIKGIYNPMKWETSS